MMYLKELFYLAGNTADMQGGKEGRKEGSKIL